MRDINAHMNACVCEYSQEYEGMSQNNMGRVKNRVGWDRQCLTLSNFIPSETSLLFGSSHTSSYRGYSYHPPSGENDLLSTQINKLNYTLQQVSIKEYTLNCFEAQNKEQNPK
jgi:hypothetical protein